MTTTTAPAPRAVARDFGLLRIGIRKDNQQAAFWRLYDPPRMQSGVIVGDPDAGGLAALELLGLRTTRLPHHQVWLLDPLHGGSAPQLHHAADHTIAGEHGVLNFIETIEAKLTRRGRAAAQHRAYGYRPTAADPGILIAITEAEEVLDDYAVRRVCEKVVRYGGRVGIALLVATRSTAHPSFGGSHTLRQHLLAANALIVHQVMPDPHETGYAWLDDHTRTIGRAEALLNYRASRDPDPVWLDHLTGEDAA